MPLAVSYVLEKAQRSGNDFKLALSFLEVYMDRCYDLLVPKEELSIMDDSKGNVVIPKLAQVNFKQHC